MSDPYGSYQPNPAPSWPGGPGQHPTFTVDRRPGTVTAAAVVTMVLSALALIAGLVFAAVSLADREEIRRQLLQNQSVHNGSYSTSDVNSILRVLTVSSVVVIVLSVVAIVLAIGVLRRSRSARILLTVLAAITIIPAVLASFGLVGLPWLAGTITVIVLLYVGGANPWFARRNAPSANPSYPGYPPAY